MMRFVELALAAFAIFILTGTNAYYVLMGIPANTPPEELEAYEAAIRNVFLLAYFIVALLAALNWQKMALGIVAVWPVMAMVAIAWLSILWSVDPETTSRRCIALTITTLMGVYLFVRFDLDEFLRFVSVVFALLIVVSLAWVFAFPDYGIHSDETHGGAWRGIFFHKNTNGRLMVFALAVFTVAAISGKVNRAFLTVFGLLALLVMIGSTSKTALLAALSIILSVVATMMVRGAAIKSALISLAVLAIVWHAGLLIYFSYEAILELLGRDPTLTGRTELWTFTLDLGFQRPLTGYGYNAFWFGDSSPGTVIAEAWGISHAHNSWIEVFINLGMPVVVLLLLTLMVTIGRGVFLARYYPDITPALLIMLTTFSMMTISMSEAVFLEKHTIDWMLTVAVIGCARAFMSKLASNRKDHGDFQSDSAEIGELGNSRPRPNVGLGSGRPVSQYAGYRGLR